MREPEIEEEATTLVIDCHCGERLEVGEDAFDAVCEACGRFLRGMWCPFCQEAYWGSFRRKARCPACKRSSGPSVELSLRATFGGTPGPDRLVGLEVIDAAGWGPDAHTIITIEIDDDGLSILTGDLDEEPVVLPYSELIDVQINGYSQVTGASFWGGGFGPAGAALGIATATALNALSRRERHWTVFSIVATGGFVTLRSEDPSTDDIRLALRPARDAIVARTSAPSSVAIPKADPDDELLDRLERLAALREGGALTAEEYALAKKRLLG